MPPTVQNSTVNLHTDFGHAPLADGQFRAVKPGSPRVGAQQAANSQPITQGLGMGSRIANFFGSASSRANSIAKGALEQTSLSSAQLLGSFAAPSGQKPDARDVQAQLQSIKNDMQPLLSQGHAADDVLGARMSVHCKHLDSAQLDQLSKLLVGFLTSPDSRNGLSPDELNLLTTTAQAAQRELGGREMALLGSSEAALSTMSRSGNTSSDISRALTSLRQDLDNKAGSNAANPRDVKSHLQAKLLKMPDKGLMSLFTSLSHQESNWAAELSADDGKLLADLKSIALSEIQRRTALVSSKINSALLPQFEKLLQTHSHPNANSSAIKTEFSQMKSHIDAALNAAGFTAPSNELKAALTIDMFKSLCDYALKQGMVDTDTLIALFRALPNKTQLSLEKRLDIGSVAPQGGISLLTDVAVSELKKKQAAAEAPLNDALTELHRTLQKSNPLASALEIVKVLADVTAALDQTAHTYTTELDLPIEAYPDKFQVLNGVAKKFLDGLDSAAKEQLTKGLISPELAAIRAPLFIWADELSVSDDQQAVALGLELTACQTLLSILRTELDVPRSGQPESTDQQIADGKQAIRLVFGSKYPESAWDIRPESL